MVYQKIKEWSINDLWWSKVYNACVWDVFFSIIESDKILGWLVSCFLFRLINFAPDHFKKGSTVANWWERITGWPLVEKFSVHPSRALFTPIWPLIMPHSNRWNVKNLVLHLIWSNYCFNFDLFINNNAPLEKQEGGGPICFQWTRTWTASQLKWK